MRLQLAKTKKDAQDVLLVNRSYGRCCVQPEFFDIFYDSFMSQSSAIADLFAHTDMKSQKIALRTGIAHLISFAKGKGIAKRKIREFGERHNRENMGVTPEMYELWIESLLEAVAKFDSQFDEEAESAWRNVLSKGIDLMTSMY